MKRKISAFLAACLAALTLAGCGGNQSGTVGSTAPVSSQSKVATETSTESTESAAEETTQSQDNSEASEQEKSEESSKTDSKASSAVSSEAVSKTESSQSDNSKTQSSVTSQDSKPAQTSQTSKSEQQTSQVSQTSSKPVQTSTRPVETSSQPEKPTPEPSKPTTSKPEESKTSTPEQSKPVETSHVSEKPATPTTTEYDIGGIALYNQLFNLENKVCVEISMSDAEIKKLQADYNKYTGSDDNKKSSIYRKATVTFTVNSQKYTLEEVGIRLKGNQSIEPLYDRNGKPNICSFKLSFDEAFDDKTDYGSDAKKWSSAGEREARKKRKFASMNELDIKWNISYDNTNIREIYATKLFESEGLLVQKIGLSQMKFNGNSYGLVKIYEPIDTTFLRKRLPEAAIGGDLYKCMWSECNNSGVRTGGWRGATYQLNNSYGVQDNQSGKKFNFNLKTNKKTSKHTQLKNLLTVLNKSNPTRADFESVLDMDYYARFMAASYFAGDPDDMRNNYNNHYVYFRKDTGKAIFIVYDNDRTLGITYGLNRNCATRNPYSSYAATQNDQQNPLIKKTISHDIPSAFTYIRDGLYKQALDRLASSNMMKSSDDFNKMYQLAKKNYESIITPYTRFANQDETFRFSLDGNKNGGDRDNMSFEQFRSQIISTYKSAKP